MEARMANRINKKKLKEFFSRRKINFFTLLVITLLSIVVTLFCRFTGYIPGRVVILEIVSLLLMLLCCIQAFRMRRSFRTIKDFKGKRKKRVIKEE